MRLRFLLALAAAVLLAGCNGDKPGSADKAVFEESFRRAWSEVNRADGSRRFEDVRELKSCEVLRVVPDASGKNAKVTMAYTYTSGGKVTSSKKTCTFHEVAGKWNLDGYEQEWLGPTN
jgi:hypothetical protein